MLLLLARRLVDDAKPSELKSALPADRVHVLRVGSLSVGALHKLLRDRLGSGVSAPDVARELEVLEHVVVGKRNEAIAFELGIASATVAKHLEHAYRKLGVQNRIAAAALLGSTR